MKDEIQRLIAAMKNQYFPNAVQSMLVGEAIAFLHQYVDVLEEVAKREKLK